MLEQLERYIARLKARYGLMLLGTLLLWASLALAVVLYALLAGIWTFGKLTWAAVHGGIASILIALFLWIFFALSVALVVALRQMWLQSRRERWDAEIALDELESCLESSQTGTGYLEDLRSRLAERGLEALERRVLGEPGHKEDSMEQRLMALHAAVDAGRISDPDSPVPPGPLHPLGP